MALAAVALIPSPLSAGVLGPVDIGAHESGVQRTRFVGRPATLYNYRWETDRSGDRVTFTARGNNNKSGAARVEWTERSVMEITAAGIRTVSWAKDSSGAEQESWKMDYNWAAHTAAYSYRNRATGKTDSKTVHFGANAYPADAMYFLLRGFPFENGVGAKISGEFVLTDGQVFTGTVILRAEERLNTPMGTIDTYKLEFKLGGLLGSMAPRMYMWFTRSAPHVFVRYEGKEDGLTSPRTVNELMSCEPAGCVPAQAPAANGASVQ